MEIIIDALPQYIVYIWLGFIAYRIFFFVASIKDSNEYEHIIWRSLFIGYVLKNTYSLFPISINYAADLIGMSITTIVLSLLVAKVYSCPYIDNFLKKIKVNKNRNKYIWQDLIAPDYLTYVNAINPETNEVYSGILIYVEEYSEQPKIVLTHYQYWENPDNEKPKHDFSKSPEYIIVVDTSLFSRISIKYDKNSKKVRKMQTT